MSRRVDGVALVAGVAIWAALACARPSPAEPAHSAETSASAGGPPGEVVVEVVGLRNDEGQVLIALFRTPDGFPDDRDRAEASAARRIRDGRVRHVFSDVDPGPYAVAVLHDENENFEMDTNFLGMPREGYGVSRGATRRMGPPRFDDARLSRAPGEGAVVRIQVVYP